MRFSETLRFNANPDWWSEYISYDELKVHVSTLRRLRQLLSSSRTTTPATDNSSPRPESSDDDDVDDSTSASASRTSASANIASSIHRSASKTVLATLNRSSSRNALSGLDRVPSARSGYSSILQPPPFERENVPTRLTLSEVKATFDNEEDGFKARVIQEAAKANEFYLAMRKELRRVTAELERDIRHAAPLQQPSEEQPLLRSSPSSSSYPAGARGALSNLKRRLVDHYRELTDICYFGFYNRSGLDKILKKHDKYSGMTLRQPLMSQFERTCAFFDLRPEERQKDKVERLYGSLFADGDKSEARDMLSRGLKKQIMFDRNTIWRDMLRVERKVSAIRYQRGGEPFELDGRPVTQFLPKKVPLAVAIVAFSVILMFPGFLRALPAAEKAHKYSLPMLDAANRCLALLIAVIILWATEAVPLYVTSFVVILLVPLLHLYVNSKGIPLGPQEAAKEVFKNMTSSTILLVVCVYTLGAALSKYGIDKIAATEILSRVKQPNLLVFVVLWLSVIISIFVSNVAAPVLLISVLLPLMQNMPISSKPLVDCILFSIMIGSNIGGYASPISSPQSAVALGLLHGRYRVSFLQWFEAALPLCATMIVCAYGGLTWWFKPASVPLPPIARHKEKFQWPHYVTLATISATIMLWTFHNLSDEFGSAGIVAVFPLFIFYGTGILSKEDFNNLPWDVVYLVAGGIVLGSAVQSSKLLSMTAERLLAMLGGSSLWVTYAILSTFMCVVANAISHTVSAIIILPLIYEVGHELGHPQLLVMAGTFAASSAMALPISSFPNISVAQVTDEVGERYVTSEDILRIGIIITGVCAMVILSFGYVLMFWMGF